ncbi:MAG: helix-turn-helix transcriptional regulator [Clostridia bacterium]|nr:helix-turn-helix transcriptional regulator [Clostridia bacterium]
MREQLKNLRISKGYTQEAISEKVSLTARQYQNIEAGTSNGSICVWEKLRDILGAESIDYLLEQDDQ